MNQQKADIQTKTTIQSIGHDRIDYQFYDPQFFKTIDKLKEISNNQDIELISLKELVVEGRNSLTGGATPLGAAYLTDGILFIRVQNVRRTGLELSDAVYIAKQMHEGELKRSQLLPNDVLLTITGVTYGIASVFPNGIGPANINQHVVKIRVKQNEILPDYLALYLNSEFGRSQTDRNVTGGSRPALDYTSIRGLQILRPEISGQERIVKAVKEIRQEAAEIKQHIEQLESSYDKIFLDKLGFRLPEEPKVKNFLTQLQEEDRFEVKWHYPFYEDVINRIKVSNSRKIESYNHELKYGASLCADYVSETPFLRIENLKRNYIDASDLQYVPNSVYRNEINNLYLQKDDILIARSGSVGLCSYVPEGFENYVYGSYIIRLRLLDKHILPEYLSVYLNSILGKLQFDKQKTGSSQFNINISQIRDLWIIEPDGILQYNIAKDMFDLVNEVNSLKTQYNKKLKQADTLFINMLQEA